MQLYGTYDKEGLYSECKVEYAVDCIYKVHSTRILVSDKIIQMIRSIVFQQQW